MEEKFCQRRCKLRIVVRAIRIDGVVSCLPRKRRTGAGEGCGNDRSEEHTSELQSLMRISYAVFCLKKKNNLKQSTYLYSLIFYIFVLMTRRPPRSKRTDTLIPDPTLFRSHLEGFDRRKTPLSDHLLEVMERWRKSFVSVDANFELLFERFELMGSLAAFHENDEQELEKAAGTIAARNDVLAWMPVGRSSWHGSTAKILLQELERGTHVAELLSSGFAKGSPRMLELFIQNLNIVASRQLWYIGRTS